jgi:hypothetical protein
MQALLPKSGTALGITLILVLALAISPVTALKVENPKILADVAPGETARFPLAISLGTGEAASNISIEVLGFGQAAEGMYTRLPADQDTGPYTARPFVSVEAPSVRLEPGQRKDFDATVKVPATVGDGGRYALIFIRPAAGQGGQAGFAPAVAVPVMLTVKDTPLTHTGSITKLTAGKVPPGNALQVQTTLRNTGNHHYYGALVNVTVSDPAGQVIQSSSTQASAWALIPGNEMTLSLPITGTLNPGTYTVRSEAKIGEGMVSLDSETASFTIDTPYVPPTQAGAVTPAGTTVPGGSGEPKKLPFLPIYVPGPDAVLVTGALAAALLLWSRRS